MPLAREAGIPTWYIRTASSAPAKTFARSSKKVTTSKCRRTKRRSGLSASSSRVKAAAADPPLNSAVAARIDFRSAAKKTESMRTIVATPAILLVVVATALLSAEDDRGIRLGEHTKSQWRFGVSILAVGGPASGIVATLPVPMDWPEQQVKRLSEERSASVGRVTYRTLESGVTQMVVSIPKLAAGDEASVIATYEITKSRIQGPADPSVYQIPAKTSVDLAKFLKPSPFIESKASEIESLAAQLKPIDAAAWDQAAALFDWVRANVKYEFAIEIKPAVAALKDRQGDCEELSSLVIALCRASKIPARAVWVPGHCYPEFYLLDERGRGHWFPCQAAGADRQFGSMIEDRPILQKGDNFKVPEESGPQRYVKQHLSVKAAAAPPEYKFVMERV